MRYYALMAHAYYGTGDLEQGTKDALSFAHASLSLGDENITVLRYTSFSVDDARSLIGVASQGSQARAIIISTSRLFHEAQNALLKLFEEPVAGTTLILLVPSDGILLPTLRSRLTKLPQGAVASREKAKAFLALSPEDRKKALDKIYTRSKSDKQDEKQEARREALELAQNLTIHFYGQDEGQMKMLLLKDLDFFTRALHERSTPLKLVFEHLLAVLPEGRPLSTAKV